MLLLVAELLLCLLNRIRTSSDYSYCLACQSQVKRDQLPPGAANKYRAFR
jgi:hypothetical protein